MILDSTKDDPVNDHGDEYTQPCKEGDKTTEKSTKVASSKSEGECDECKDTGNGVEDHDVGETLEGVFGATSE